MRDNSDRRRKRAAAVVCAALAAAFLGILLAAVVYPLLGIGSGDGLAVLLLALYALIILAVIGGVLAALRQRLREIESGEEEDAAQY